VRTVLVVLTILSLSFSSLDATPKIYADILEVEVLNVYDGDTFKVNINGYPALIGKNISIRIRDIDAPEIRGGNFVSKYRARLSRDFLANLLKDKIIILKNIGRGKYFRILAEVYANDLDVGDYMISQGYAERYK